METTLSKTAKVVFVTCLVIFIFQDNSLYVINLLKELIINNLFIFTIVVILTLLILNKKMKGGK